MRWPGRAALVGSAAVGVALTLLTGLVDVTPNLVGARWYGLPWTWIRRLVIAPQYNPWRVDWAGLALDMAFWVALLLLVAVLISQLRRQVRVLPGQPPKPLTQEPVRQDILEERSR